MNYDSLKMSTRDRDYILHPAILDAAFQVALFRPFTGDHDDNIYYLPHRIGSITFKKTLKIRYFPNHVFVHCTFKKWSTGMFKLQDLMRPSSLITCRHRSVRFSVYG